MKIEIDPNFELEVAEFYQSLGITQGPGDVQYRLILLALARNGENKITKFSEIRRYTDQFADRGSIGSKMKTVFQLEGLVEKVERGGYLITKKGLIAASFLLLSTDYYRKVKMTEEMIERIP
ncbi:MAG: hypothetical protein ACXQT3_02410 [Methermicoccaceae archaeon]